MKTYDNTEVVTVGETKPERVVSISDSTLDAVKRGMLATPSPAASVYNAFRNLRGHRRRQDRHLSAGR